MYLRDKHPSQKLVGITSKILGKISESIDDDCNAPTGIQELLIDERSNFLRLGVLRIIVHCSSVNCPEGDKEVANNVVKPNIITKEIKSFFIMLVFNFINISRYLNIPVALSIIHYLIIYDDLI